MSEYDIEIEKYINELPSELQKQIRDNVWKLTLSDISKKYSLSEEQKINLEREVMFVMIGIEDELDLNQNLITELSVSKILSDELVDEIGNKIFNTISNKINNSLNPQSIQKVALSKINHIPDNLPTEEPLPPEDEEVVTEKTIDHSEEKALIEKQLQEQLQGVAEEKNKEQIQEPVSRSPINFFDQKLNTPTVSPKENIQSNPTPERPVKQYVSDPYREPVE